MHESYESFLVLNLEIICTSTGDPLVRLRYRGVSNIELSSKQFVNVENVDELFGFFPNWYITVLLMNLQTPLYNHVIFGGKARAMMRHSSLINS